MDLFFWLMYVFLPVVGIIALIGVPVLGTIFWKKVLPKVSRDLMWCKLKGMSPAIICHDSGRAELQMFQERRGSGVVMTNKGKYKILPRFTSIDESNNPLAKIIAEEQAVTNPDEPVNPDETSMATPEAEKRLKKISKTLNVLRDYSDFVTKRSILMGLGLPLFLGYSGKLCLFHPDALALYEAGQMQIKTEDVTYYKGDPKKQDEAPEPLILLDPRAIKVLINQGFDETQMAAVTTDAELVGMIGRPSNAMKWILVVVIIVVAVLGILFLPSILPKAK